MNYEPLVQLKSKGSSPYVVQNYYVELGYYNEVKAQYFLGCFVCKVTLGFVVVDDVVIVVDVALQVSFYKKV